MKLTRRHCLISASGLLSSLVTGGAIAQTTDKAQNAKSIVVYYSHSGTVKRIAERIGVLTNSPVVVIEPETPYPTDYSSTTELVQDQMKKGIVPPNKPMDIDFNAYDTIYVGSPTWWGHISRPLERFLADTNLEGKRIKLFTSHGGSGRASTQDDIERLAPKSNVVESIAFYGGANDQALRRWVNE